MERADAGDSNSNSVNDKKIPMRYFRLTFSPSSSVEFNLILIGGNDHVGGRGGEGEGESRAGGEDRRGSTVMV